MAQLRTVSTRAEITSSGFVKHYEWGRLKADPTDWMRHYFNAFVYTTNWCSCRLAVASRDDRGDDALEPGVPHRLSELSPPQQALADFLEIDSDMRVAAIAGSGRVAQYDAAQVGHVDAPSDRGGPVVRVRSP